VLIILGTRASEQTVAPCLLSIIMRIIRRTIRVLYCVVEDCWWSLFGKICWKFVRDCCFQIEARSANNAGGMNLQMVQESVGNIVHVQVVVQYLVDLVVIWICESRDVNQVPLRDVELVAASNLLRHNLQKITHAQILVKLFHRH